MPVAVTEDVAKRSKVNPVQQDRTCAVAKVRMRFKSRVCKDRVTRNYIR